MPTATVHMHTSPPPAVVALGQRVGEFREVSDARDQALAEQYAAARQRLPADKILVGDVLMLGERAVRVAYDWGDAVQWAPDGSFFLYANGGASMSGSLESSLPVEEISPTGFWLPASFWFFHHGYSGAHRGVQATIAVRVWRHLAADGRVVVTMRESLEARGIRC